MSIINIRPLKTLDPADIRRLNSGYTSPAKYALSKEETSVSTVIAMRRVELSQPYVKSWETVEADIALLQEAIQDKLSLAAYAGDQMVGITIAEKRKWNRTLWVWEFHIDPAYHRQGIGRRLMQTLADLARQQGLRVMVCETQSTNVPAIDFYRAVGFEVGGLDLSYYTNDDLPDGEVAIFMKRKL